jgi:cupin fold WbuC family metalloprotein
MQSHTLPSIQCPPAGSTPSELQVVNPHVAIVTSDITELRARHIDWLEDAARASPRHRARICAHRQDSDAVHEMLIAITDQSYVRPHRHVGKSESFHVVRGCCDVVVFDEQGAIEKVVALGPPDSGRAFFYRLDSSRFHTLVLRTPLLVIHEVTKGPFVAGDSIAAPFAPEESDTQTGALWMQALHQQIDAFECLKQV